MNKTLFAAVLSTVLFSSVSVFAAPKTYTEAEVVQESEKYDMMCNQGAGKVVEKIDFKFRYDYEEPTEPEHTTTYFVVTCVSGAYNESSILLQGSDYTDLLAPVSFAFPMLNRAGKLVGFAAEIVVGSLTYDPSTQKLSTFSKGRGIGDMYVSGTYAMHEQDIILRSYTIDNKAGNNEVPPVFENNETLH